MVGSSQLASAEAPVMRGAIRCGQNSLPIYCLGVLLAFVSYMALLGISNGLAMQIALSVGGIMAMVVTATLLTLISIKPRRQRARNSSLLSENEATKRCLNPLGNNVRFGGY